jgi:TetR/AcrR family transcriptional repressor of mexJK operon
LIIKTSTTESRPGRPKSAEKAAAILDAAADLFLSEGLDSTSMDDIAAAAGVSKQTVYSHFRSKEELFRACVLAKVEGYELDAAALADDAALDAVLRHIGRQYLTLLVDPQVIAMFRLMAASASAFPPIVEIFYESGPVATMQALVERLMRQAPEIDEKLAAQLASEYLALVRSCYFLELLLGIRADVPEEERKAHVEHCIAQMKKLYAFL